MSLIELLEARIVFASELPAGFGETVIADNLGPTTAIDALPDGRVLLALHDGDLRIASGGTLLPTPVLQITVDDNGERGLIGVTHDPKFNTNHFIYIYHTVPSDGSSAPFNEISRYTLVGNVADPSSRVDILQLNDLSSATNHNGGAIHFGLDGMLYVGVGENANSSNSQTLSTLLGKVLRIDVSKIHPGDPINDVAKLVPSSNPFVGTAQGINGAIFALGFRNPFTFAVNPLSGTIFVDDVGENTWEEIDKLVPGGNYGWHDAEGFSSTLPPTGLGPGTYQNPQLAYNHNGGPAGGGNAIIGGLFYDPPTGATDPFPSSYTGKYFYGDYGHSWIRNFSPADPGSLKNPDTSAAFEPNTQTNPSGMALGTDGSIYYAATGTGELVQIFAEDKTAITHPPHSQTVLEGDSATFSARAIGTGTLIYRWQRNNGAGGAFVNIPHGTSSSYTLAQTALTDSGARFRIEVISTGKKAVSKPVTLTVNPQSAMPGIATPGIVSSGIVSSLPPAKEGSVLRKFTLTDLVGDLS
jgi:glucose/arabinose dehydrogenase